MITFTSAVQRSLQLRQIDKIPSKKPPQPPPQQPQAVDSLEEVGQTPPPFRCTISKYALKMPGYSARLFKLDDGDYLMLRRTKGRGLLGTGAAGRCYLGRSPQGEWLCIKEISLVAPPSRVQFKPKTELTVDLEHQQYLRQLTQTEAVIASSFGGALAPWFYLERSDGRKIYLIAPLGVASLQDISLFEWANFVPPAPLRKTILDRFVGEFFKEENIRVAKRNEWAIGAGLDPDNLNPTPLHKAVEWVEGMTYHFRNLFPHDDLGKQWRGEAIWSLLRSVTTDLVKLHKHGVLHNDLRAANIVVGGADHLPHLIDFNCTINLHKQAPWGDSWLPPPGAPLINRAPELAGYNIHGFHKAHNLRRRDWLKSDIYALAWTIIDLFRSNEHEVFLRIPGESYEIFRQLTINDGLAPADVELIHYWELSGKNQVNQRAWPTLPLSMRQQIDSCWQVVGQLPQPLPQLLAQMMSIRPHERPSAAELLEALDSQPIASPEEGKSWWHFFQPERFYRREIDVFAYFEQVEAMLQQEQQLAVGLQKRTLTADQVLPPTGQIPPVLGWWGKLHKFKPKKIQSIAESLAMPDSASSSKTQDETLTPSTSSSPSTTSNAQDTPATADEEDKNNSVFSYKTLAEIILFVSVLQQWWPAIQENFFSQSKPAA